MRCLNSLPGRIITPPGLGVLSILVSCLYLYCDHGRSPVDRLSPHCYGFLSRETSSSHPAILLTQMLIVITVTTSVLGWIAYTKTGKVVPSSAVIPTIHRTSVRGLTIVLICTV
jgi:hypothetical protein